MLMPIKYANGNQVGQQLVCRNGVKLTIGPRLNGLSENQRSVLFQAVAHDQAGKSQSAIIKFSARPWYNPLIEHEVKALRFLEEQQVSSVPGFIGDGAAEVVDKSGGHFVAPYLVESRCGGVKAVDYAAVSISLPEKWFFLTCLAEQMAEINRAGVVHGDIRPENIIVRPNNQPTVWIDFGNAQYLHDPEAGRKMINDPGAAGYLAPEIYDETHFNCIHPRDLIVADIYAFGVTCLEILAGPGKNIYPGSLSNPWAAGWFTIDDHYLEMSNLKKIPLAARAKMIGFPEKLKGTAQSEYVTRLFSPLTLERPEEFQAISKTMQRLQWLESEGDRG